VHSGTGVVSAALLQQTLNTADFAIEGDNTVTVLISDGVYTGSGNMTVKKDTTAPSVINTGSVVAGINTAAVSGILANDGS